MAKTKHPYTTAVVLMGLRTEGENNTIVHSYGYSYILSFTYAFGRRLYCDLHCTGGILYILKVYAFPENLNFDLGITSVMLYFLDCSSAI